MDSLQAKLPKIAQIAKSLSPKIEAANNLLSQTFPKYNIDELYTLNIRKNVLILGVTKSHIATELYYKIPQLLNSKPKNLDIITKIVIKHVKQPNKDSYQKSKPIKASTSTAYKLAKFSQCIKNEKLKKALNKLAYSISK